jgi:hypothetical protein
MAQRTLVDDFLDALKDATVEFVSARFVDLPPIQHQKQPREPRRKNIKPPKVKTPKTPKAAKREAQGPTLYDELEVSPRASQETIRAAWVSLSKRFHPDITKDATGRMKRINAAWSTLSDPQRRREYDKSIREAR